MTSHVMKSESDHKQQHRHHQQQPVTSLKLPVIEPSVRGLVSTVKTTSHSSSIGEATSSWLSQIRDRLSAQMDSEEGPLETDVTEIKHHLVLLMITALQRDDRHSWMLLRETFSQLVPFRELLSSSYQFQPPLLCHGHTLDESSIPVQPKHELKQADKNLDEIEHYVTRLLTHLDLHKERLFDLQVPEAIKSLFPQEAERVECNNLKPTQPFGNKPLTVATPRKPMARKVPVQFQLPNGKNPYAPLVMDHWKKDVPPPSITFGDLKISLPDVAMEVAIRECIWAHCVGTTALAVDTELPEDVKPQDPLVEVFSVTSFKKASRKHDKSPRKQKHDIETIVEMATPLDGRSAVAYFTRCYHLGKIKYMFLNVAQRYLFRPYDLIGVSSNKVNPEHYIFSSFGVLHVMSSQPAESLSLSDWLRNAILYDSISKIPFFKHFLTSRMFQRWRQNRHYLAYLRLRSNLRGCLLQSVPHFGRALLRISDLCYEISNLQFLPTEPQLCFTLTELHDEIYCRLINAQRILDNFFTQARTIVEEVCRETVSNLRLCEKQVRQKRVITKESLYLRRLKREEKENNLKAAQTDTDRLDNFIVLVDQMLLSQLIKVAQLSLTTFVKGTMTCLQDSDREAVFKAQLVFSDHVVLSVAPPMAAFDELIRGVLNTTPMMLCHALRPLQVVLASEKKQKQLATVYDLRSLAQNSLSQCSQRHAAVTNLIAEFKKQRPHQYSRSPHATNSHRYLNPHMLISIRAQADNKNDLNAPSSVVTEDTSRFSSRSNSPKHGNSPHRDTSPQMDTSPQRDTSPRRDTCSRLETIPRPDTNQCHDTSRRRYTSPTSDASPRRETSPRRDASPQLDTSPRHEISPTADGKRQQESISRDVSPRSEHSPRRDNSLRPGDSPELDRRSYDEKRLQQSRSPMSEASRLSEASHRLAGHMLSALASSVAMTEQTEVSFMPFEERSSVALPADQYRPLTSKNLAEKLINDEIYQDAFDSFDTLMADAGSEVDMYCATNSWLNEIEMFCLQWGRKSLLAWDGASAFAFEQKLTELRQWTERVQTFDLSLTTANRVMYVDCSGVQTRLVPLLEKSSNDMHGFITKLATNRSEAFLKEMHLIIDNMQRKQTTMAGFAQYARHVTIYKGNLPKYQEQVDYIKSIYEMMRMNIRMLNADEEKLESQVTSNWDAFLACLQVAMEFVNVQTPLIMKNISATAKPGSAEETDVSMDASKNITKYMELEAEARNVSTIVASGIFIDPNEHPPDVLQKLRQLRERFFDVKTQLEQASKWKEAITGEPYDLDFLHQMTSAIRIREEIWKYIDVSMQAIGEWKNLPFENLSTQHCQDKLIEWQVAAGQLKPFLPPQDALLAHWYTQLERLKNKLPIMRQLADPSVKSRHWKSIFLALGEQHYPLYKPTVGDILNSDFDSHSASISSILSAARAQYAIERKLAELRIMWQERKFKLAKYFPESLLKSEETQQQHLAESSETKTKLQRLSMAPPPLPLPEKAANLDKQLYLFANIEHLHEMIEDSQVSLEMMRNSHEMPDTRQEAELLIQRLTAVKDVTQLWYNCQTKWLYLLKIFENQETCKRLPELSEKFDKVHDQIAAWMKSVSDEPRVMHVIEGNRPEKPHRRVLQGTNLQDYLTTILTLEEEILKGLDEFLLESRRQFSRLYFLSDSEMISLMSIVRNPPALLPYVRRCFPGIVSLTFSLPSTKVGEQTLFELSLNIDRLQTKTIVGSVHETLPLTVAVEPIAMATSWLRRLCQLMKRSMRRQLEQCVAACLNEDEKSSMKTFMEEVASREADERKPSSSLPYSKRFSHWLLRYPSQCVIVAMEIKWERDVCKALETRDWRMLNQLSDQQVTWLEDCSMNLRDSIAQNDVSQTRERLHNILRSLIIQAVYHRDVMDNLLQTMDVSVSAFEWLRILKYHMEFQTKLLAKTHDSIQSEEISTETTTANTADDIFMRSGLRIMTGYQFGRCELSQMGSTYAYTNEYYGPRQRLVMTPLTERAHISLTKSLRSFECGALVSPAGTGKTTIISDLALAMGRHLVCLDCTASINVSLLNNFLRGMLGAGSWVLFSAVNNLPVGMLAILGQYLDALTHALRVLSTSPSNQYTIRGQPHFDQVSTEVKIKRRNSLTTLHSLPNPMESDECMSVEESSSRSNKDSGLRRYAEDSCKRKQHRRHSIEKDYSINEMSHYRDQTPFPLFYNEASQIKRARAQLRGASLSSGSSGMPFGNVLFNGELMSASANCACFMTMTNDAFAKPASIPENFRNCFRMFTLIPPDMKSICEVMLMSHGFSGCAEVANKFTTFIQLLRTRLPPNPQYDFQLATVISVLKAAGKRLLVTRRMNYIADNKRSLHFAAVGPDYGHGYQLAASQPERMQEEALVYAIRVVLSPRLVNQSDLHTLHVSLRSIFPSSVRSKTGERTPNTEMRQEIQEQMKRNRLQPQLSLVNKVVELNDAVSSKRPVLLTGTTGSGKTTCYHILAHTLTAMHDRKMAAYMSSTETAPVKTLHHQMKNTPQLKVLRDCDPLSRPVCRKLWRRSARAVYMSHVMKRLLQPDLKPDLEVMRVVIDLVFPNALSLDQLLGHYNAGHWQDGLLCTLLGLPPPALDPVAHDMKLAKWLVLDGQLDNSWLDGVTSMMTTQRYLSMANGTVTHMNENTSLIFELSDLTDVSPATISRCHLVHCHDDMTSWRVLTDSWSEMARQKWMITNGWLKVMANLMSLLFTPTIQFLNENCSTALRFGTTGGATGYSTSGISEVTTFLTILTALMNRHFLREKFEQAGDDVSSEVSSTRGGSPADGGILPRVRSPSGMNPSSIAMRARSSFVARRRSSSIRSEHSVPHYMGIMKHMFAFCYVWGFGGGLHDSCVAKFNEFARQSLSSLPQVITLPEEGSVFDYNVNCELGTFVSWKEKPLSKLRSEANTFTVVPEVDRYHFLIELLLPASGPILLTGEPGVGKSSIVKNLTANHHSLINFRLSHAFTAQMMQAAILEQIQQLKSVQSRPSKFSTISSKWSKLVKTPTVDTSSSRKENELLFFIDDLNASMPNGHTGSQSELLRQILSQKAVYNGPGHVLTPVEKTGFVAAATSPSSIGAGPRSRLSDRLLRLCSVFNVFLPSSQVFYTIYSKGVQHWLEDFPPACVKDQQCLMNALVGGVFELFDLVRERFRCTPSRPHYIFTLHNLSDVFRGLLLFSPRAVLKCGSDTRVGNAAAITLKTVIRLWAHECTRVFSDRMFHEQDKQLFESTLEKVLRRHFCTDSSDAGSVTSELPVQQHLSLPQISRSQLGVVVGAADQSVTKDRSASLPANVLKQSSLATRSADDSHQGAPLYEASATRDEAKKSVSFRGAKAVSCINQIKLPTESLLGILFSKQLMGVADESKATKAYAECNEADLRTALQSHLVAYSEKVGEKSDIVFFREAITHMASLSRVLGIAGGHSILLSNSLCAGRRVLVRLAAFTAGCKLFEPHYDVDPVKRVANLYNHMRECSMEAGINKQQVALLVGPGFGDECLQQVAAFMKDGNCAGLYSKDQQRQIAAQMAQGQLKIKRRDKIDTEVAQFYARVLQYLHVIICADFDDQDEESVLVRTISSLSTSFLSVCHVDVFEPWKQDAYVTVARQWLTEPDTSINKQMGAAVRSLTDRQLNLVSMAMAYMHLSSEVAVRRQNDWRGKRLFTPKTFFEFVHLFHVIVAFIRQTEEAALVRYEKGVSQINDALQTIESYQQEVALLMPQHKESLTSITDYVTSIEKHRKAYIEVLDECRTQEKEIAKLQKPLEELRKKSSTALNTYSPKYEAALCALHALEPAAIDELRSYHAPPEDVKSLMKTICLIFDRPQTWEEARRLLARDFFDQLQFYDKDNLSDELLSRLEALRPCPVKLSSVSAAAACLAGWLAAICEYASVHRRMTAHEKELASAEAKVMQLETKLGKNRQKAGTMKNVLEMEIRKHKNACARVRTVERQIQSIERRMSRSDNLMTQMSEQLGRWRQELRDGKNRHRGAVTDAILTAAIVTYHGPLHNRSRASLITDWLHRCTSMNFCANEEPPQSVQRLSVTFTEVSGSESSERNVTRTIGQNEQTNGHSDRLLLDIGPADVKDDDDTCLSEQMSMYGHELSVHDSAAIFNVKVSEEKVCIPPTKSMADMPEIKNVISGLSLATDELSTSDLIQGDALHHPRTGYTLQSVLSLPGELTEWRLADLPMDIHSQHNALIMRATFYRGQHRWPLLLDPDGVAENWVRALHAKKCDLRKAFDIGKHVDVSDNDSLKNTSEQKPQSVKESLNPEYETDRRKSLAVSEVAAELVKDKLCILSADNSALPGMIIKAVSDGFTLLITGVEKTSLSAGYNSLLAKSYGKDKEGHPVVIINGHLVLVHPEFNLFLSVSTPIHLTGELQKNLALHQLNVIDMSYNQQAVVSRLLHDMMQIEKPELQAHLRSLQNDLESTKESVKNEQAALLLHVLNLQCPLLEDRTMQAELKSFQTRVQHSRDLLEQTKCMRDTLKERRKPYEVVARLGARIYETVQRVCGLCSTYHVSFAAFLKVFNEVLAECHRGHGTAGEPSARAQELMDATTSAICRHMSSMLYSRHMTVFRMLIAMERLRLAGSLSDREAAVFLRGVDTRLVTSELGGRSDWISNKVWLDLITLENTFPKVFKDLRQSLLKSAPEWQEYFKLPLSLVSDVPGTEMHHLTVFQKCLLWRIVKPNKISLVCDALTIHELGSLIEPQKSYDIDEVYEKTAKYIPVIFMLPAERGISTEFNSLKGECYSYPLSEIRHLAHSVESRVHVLSFGVASEEMEMGHALEECMRSGYWLLMQNVHLANGYSRQMLELFKDVVVEAPCDNSDSLSGSQSSLVTSTDTFPPLPAPPIGENNHYVHPNFRLWLTTRPDFGSPVPGVLVQHGIKVCCEQSRYLKDTLKRSYTDAEAILRTDSSAVGKWCLVHKHVVPLSLLHSILMHRQLLETYRNATCWSRKDLKYAMENTRVVLSLCQAKPTEDSDIFSVVHCAALAVGESYSNQCPEPRDRLAVEALAQRLIQHDRSTTLEVDTLLRKLLPSEGGTFDERIASLGDSVADVSATRNFQEGDSRAIQDDLTRVTCLDPYRHLSTHYDQALVTLTPVISTLATMPPQPSPPSPTLYPLDVFLRAECFRLATLVTSVRRYATLLSQVAQGTITATADTERHLVDISQGIVPDVWLRDTGVKSDDPVRWAERLVKRAHTLIGYLDEGQNLYDLGMFLRPDRFLEAVRLEFVRRQFCDLHTTMLHTQVMPDDERPPIKTGVYVTGLQLHHAAWDTASANLAADASETYQQTCRPLTRTLPPIWVKPGAPIPPSDQVMYSCPVYAGKDIFMTVRLPARQSPEIWAEKRVYATCF